MEDEFADDSLLLSNLPTSVDDLQNKEFNLKLERNQNSPLVSRRGSPVLTANASSNGAFVESLDCTADTLDRTRPQSLNKSFDELDADDLEVNDNNKLY